MDFADRDDWPNDGIVIELLIRGIEKFFDILIISAASIYRFLTIFLTYTETVPSFPKIFLKNQIMVLLKKLLN